MFHMRLVDSAAERSRPTWAATAQEEEGAATPPVRLWPGLVALFVVALLSILSIGVSEALERSTVERTARLVDDELRSIEIIDDIRFEVHALDAAASQREDATGSAERIADDELRLRPSRGRSR